MNQYKVIVWGTGMVGQYALRYILSNPRLSLVGVKCYTPTKEGMDAAELGGSKRAPTGVKATCDAQAVLTQQADCVIFVPHDPLTDPTIEGSPSSAWVPDLLGLLRSGK